MKQNRNQTLFNFSATATARNSDPETSHMAADRMNSGAWITKHQNIVLRLISHNPGLTAKELGGILQKERPALTGCYEWPRKRAKELESKLLIRRELLPGESELRNYVTDIGKNFLKSQNKS